MIDLEVWAEVRRLRRVEGCKVAAIARRLGLDRKTVRRIIAQTTHPGVKRVAPRRGSMIDPYRETIGRWLAQADLSAVQVHARLKKEQGYTGEITLVRDYVREIRKREAEAFLRLTYLPGACAQVDWAHMGSVLIGRTRRRVSAFVMVLAYSRLMYVELTLSERVDAFLEAHGRAFAFFQGVPGHLLYDNCRTVVLQRLAAGIRFHPRLLEFADHHLFAPRACPPRRPWHKGRVESGIRYVRANFVRGRQPIESLADFERAQRELAAWRDETANLRIHKVTRRKPRELFEEAERGTLRPLPPGPCDTAHLVSVSVNKSYRVAFDGNRYTVPYELAHERGLILRATSREVRIYNGETLVAVHRRSYGRGEDVRGDAHDRGLREKRRRAERHVLLGRFVALLGPEAESYAMGLARAHVRAAHHLRRIVSLVERCGAEDVRKALILALAHEAYGADYVENLVHQERRKRLAGPAHPPPVLRDEQLAAVALLEPDLDRYQDLIEKGVPHGGKGDTPAVAGEAAGGQP